MYKGCETELEKENKLSIPLDSSKEDLIERINRLGPWVHAYFELGTDLVIRPPDDGNLNRILYIRDIVFGYLKETYDTKAVRSSLLDVGCNSGFFSMEASKFGFGRVLGIDPRIRNIRKAEFAKGYLDEMRKVQFKVADILETTSQELGTFEVSLFLGVMYHLYNPMRALENLYDLTNDIVIIQSVILNPNIESDSLRKDLDIFDYLPQEFGAIGVKTESAVNDGQGAVPGIVMIPSANALKMMLKHVGFQNIEELDDPQKDFRPSDVRPYRKMVILKAEKDPSRKVFQNLFDSRKRAYELRQFNNYITISRLDKIEGARKDSDITHGHTVFRVIELLKKLFQSSIQHPTEHKVDKNTLLYMRSRALYESSDYDNVIDILRVLLSTPNLDWNLVYFGYFLRALTYEQLGDIHAAKREINYCLETNPYFILGYEAKKRISSLIENGSEGASC